MSRKFLSFVCASLAFLAISAISPVLAGEASCLIKSSGTTLFRGVCNFQSESNGSFSLDAGKSGRFLKNIDVVTVYIRSRGKAEVRGLTKAGINSRWGSARRSRKDRACWLGSDFKICAW